jgi:tetratricopeptide (TPR) repeat protein
MERYASFSARGRVTLVDVTKAQATYEPAEPPGSAEIPSIDTKGLEARVRQDLSEVISWREAYLASRYSETRQGLEATPAALNEVAHVYLLAGKTDEARHALEQALAKEPGSAGTLNNLANVDAAEGDFAKAMDRYGKAVAMDRSDAGLWLNLGLAHYAVGDSAGADEPLARGIELSGGYEAACALLGLKAEEVATREGTRKMSAEETRLLLKGALRKVPATARARGGAAPAAPGPDKWTSRVAAGRGAELSDLLYWKK